MVSAYQYTLQYIPGQNNQCADCMSRLLALEYMASALAMDIAPLPVTSKEITKAAIVLQSIRHGNWSTIPTDCPLYFRRRTELIC